MAILLEQAPLPTVVIRPTQLLAVHVGKLSVEDVAEASREIIPAMDDNTRYKGLLISMADHGRRNSSRTVEEGSPASKAGV